MSNSPSDSPSMSPINAHFFEFDNAHDGGKIKLSDFAGKAILVVNTASKCGFTNQYGNMQKLWEEYKDKGLVVIAVPSNDFGAQEPGTEAQICEFTETQYNITFPITSKYKVTGKDAHPFYKWANKKAGFIGSPKWNFHKYLIGADGNFVDWYSSNTVPDAKKIKTKIDEILP